MLKTFSSDCGSCPLRKRPAFLTMSERELNFMTKFKVGELSIEAGAHLLSQGAQSAQLFTVLSGFGLRHKTLVDGSRQVISFVLPGDFIGLQAGIMGEMGHSVEAVGPMVLCVFNRSDVWNLFTEMPERGFALAHLAAIEEHFLGDALATVGQRAAYERVAWALHRYVARCDSLGLKRGNTCPFPFRQQDLADALGLSIVHTNKMLSKLRKNQIASIQGGELSISNFKTLTDIAEYDEGDNPRPLI